MMRRRLLPLVACVALVAACTGGGDDDDAEPGPTTDPTTPTTVVDRSGIALAGVPGQTTSTIEERGSARIGGSVKGPEGPLAGATVRIERLVAGREIRTDVLTGPDGRFLVEGMPGGRYRVRAYLAPTFAQLEPEVRFLADAEEHQFDLTVEAQSGVVVRADVAPEPPLLDGAVNLVAVVVTRSVGADGVVRSVPVVGVTVELVGLGRWVLRDDRAPDDGEDDDPAEDDPDSTTSSTFGLTTTSTTTAPPSSVSRTDGSGRVRFELRCERAGAPGLALRVPVRTSTPSPAPGAATSSTTAGSGVTLESFALEVPACVDPATTTTVAPSTTSPSTTAG